MPTTRQQSAAYCRYREGVTYRRHFGMFRAQVVVATSDGGWPYSSYATRSLREFTVSVRLRAASAHPYPVADGVPLANASGETVIR